MGTSLSITSSLQGPMVSLILPLPAAHGPQCEQATGAGPTSTLLRCRAGTCCPRYGAPGMFILSWLRMSTAGWTPATELLLCQDPAQP